MLGDGIPARRHLEDSLALYHQLGARRGVVWSLINLAVLDFHEDRLSEMDVHLGEALPLARESGHPQTLGWVLNQQALLAGRRGDYDQERSAAEEALGLFRRSSDHIGIVYALNHLAGALQGQGDYTNSVPLLQEALAQPGSMGTPSATRTLLGHAALATGDVESAKGLYQQAADLARKRSLPYQTVFPLCHLGEVALSAGNLDDASAHYTAALGEHQDLPPPALLCMIVSGCAKLALTRGEPQSAARLLGAVEAMRHSLGIRLPPIIRTSQEQCAELARLALGDDQYEAAQDEGRQLTTEEAVALIHTQLGPA
jgi:tetratricopeptide (TPR) repeat protein